MRYVPRRCAGETTSRRRAAAAAPAHCRWARGGRPAGRPAAQSPQVRLSHAGPESEARGRGRLLMFPPVDGEGVPLNGAKGPLLGRPRHSRASDLGNHRPGGQQQPRHLPRVAPLGDVSQLPSGWASRYRVKTRSVWAERKASCAALCWAARWWDTAAGELRRAINPGCTLTPRRGSRRSSSSERSTRLSGHGTPPASCAALQPALPHQPSTLTSGWECPIHLRTAPLISTPTSPLTALPLPSTHF